MEKYSGKMTSVPLNETRPVRLYSQCSRKVEMSWFWCSLYFDLVTQHSPAPPPPPLLNSSTDCILMSMPNLLIFPPYLIAFSVQLYGRLDWIPVVLCVTNVTGSFVRGFSLLHYWWSSVKSTNKRDGQRFRDKIIWWVRTGADPGFSFRRGGGGYTAGAQGPLKGSTLLEKKGSFAVPMQVEQESIRLGPRAHLRALAANSMYLFVLICTYM